MIPWHKDFISFKTENELLDFHKPDSNGSETLWDFFFSFVFFVLIFFVYIHRRLFFCHQDPIQHVIAGSQAGQRCDDGSHQCCYGFTKEILFLIIYVSSVNYMKGYTHIHTQYRERER